MKNHCRPADLERPGAVLLGGLPVGTRRGGTDAHPQAEAHSLLQNMSLLFLLLLPLFTPSLSVEELEPAIRVVRLQLDYKNASINSVQKINKWNSIMRNSVLASLRFINKHWLICGGEKSTSDCGKAQVTGEIIDTHSYRINVTFISERDPIRNAKVEATSTVSAVTNIGLKGGIFQYTNALKALGKPEPVMLFDEAFFCYKGAILEGGDQCRPCASGSFHDGERCQKCPKGRYQPEAGSSFCFTCQAGTTSNPAAIAASDCFPICPSGYYFDRSSKTCEECGLRGYQPEMGADSCIACPHGTVPIHGNSTSIDHCLENCRPGWQRSSEESHHCEKCSIGSYKGDQDSVCMACPTGKSTMNTASKSLEDCKIRTCFPGTYFDTATMRCEACDYGKYQDEYDARICKSCPINTSTYKTGAAHITDCESTNQCKSGKHNCHWLAVCIDLPDDNHKRRYSCKCKPGFLGNGVSCVDACDGFCANDGLCIKTARGEVRCNCKNGFTGRRCQSVVV